MNTQPNAAPVELTEEQLAAQAFIADIIKNDPGTAAVIVLKLSRDGHVSSMGGTTVINPPDLVPRICSELAGVLQDRFAAAVHAGDTCNCSACISKRGGAFMSPTTKAEA